MKRVEEIKQRIESEMNAMIGEYLYEFYPPDIQVTVELDDYEISKLKRREQRNNESQ